jgi:hypothetical protein
MIWRRRTAKPWSWSDVRKRSVGIYSAEREGRSRSAVLVWQGDDPRVALGGSAPPLLAFTMSVEAEADEFNAVSLTGFDSLEAARAHCVDWVGEAREAEWSSLGEAAQIGLYASIREPGFAAGE